MPTTTIPTWTPPRWLNALMTGLLRTPLLQRLVGRSTALISFTGHKTGRHHTTPVTYVRDGDTVTVVTKRMRPWWRNFEGNPYVELRLAGRTHTGAVQLLEGIAAQERFTTFLEKRRRDARAYGLRPVDGRLDPDAVAMLLPQVVVLDIRIV